MVVDICTPKHNIPMALRPNVITFSRRSGNRHWSVLQSPVRETILRTCNSFYVNVAMDELHKWNTLMVPRKRSLADVKSCSSTHFSKHNGRFNGRQFHSDDMNQTVLVLSKLFSESKTLFTRQEIWVILFTVEDHKSIQTWRHTWRLLICTIYCYNIFRRWQRWQLFGKIDCPLTARGFRSLSY